MSETVIRTKVGDPRVLQFWVLCCTDCRLILQNNDDDPGPAFNAILPQLEPRDRAAVDRARLVRRANGDEVQAWQRAVEKAEALPLVVYVEGDDPNVDGDGSALLVE